jgi:hypothetical protein
MAFKNAEEPQIRVPVPQQDFASLAAERETEVKSSSRRPKLRTKKGMSEPRYPSGKSVEVNVKLKAYRDQAAIVGSTPKPGFEINDQLSDNNQDAVAPWPKF